MSESKFETVSMLVDNYQLTDGHFDKVIKDEQLSDAWDHYHLIGDIMRGEAPESIRLDLSEQIAAAIAEEPTILAPQPAKTFSEQFKGKVLRIAKPFGQMAIAASAAGLMILGVQHTNVANNNPVPNQVIHTIPLGGIADPVSYDVEQPDRAEQQRAYIEQQRRFQALLSDHRQQIKLNNAAKAKAQQEAEDTPK